MVDKSVNRRNRAVEHAYGRGYLVGVAPGCTLHFLTLSCAIASRQIKQLQ